MLKQADDFRAEAEELHNLLATLDDQDWQQATLFKGWTVNDIVQHLHDSDLMAAASVAGPEAFNRLRTEIQASRNKGLSRIEETRQRLGSLTGRRLLDQWHTTMADLCDRLSALPADARLTWYGPDMGVRMFATARQMETWAHGQAIYDLLGADREPTDRLRNIAEIGARTYGWTFANRGQAVPGPAPHIRLQAPGGEIWEWNDPTPGNSVTGLAQDFCQVVTQVRNVADTGLTVTGQPARTWMSLAQCFAGPPENPPAPGTRFRAPTPLRRPH